MKKRLLFIIVLMIFTVGCKEKEGKKERQLVKSALKLIKEMHGTETVKQIYKYWRRPTKEELIYKKLKGLTSVYHWDWGLEIKASNVNNITLYIPLVYYKDKPFENLLDKLNDYKRLKIEEFSQQVKWLQEKIKNYEKIKVETENKLKELTKKISEISNTLEKLHKIIQHEQLFEYQKEELSKEISELECTLKKYRKEKLYCEKYLPHTEIEKIEAQEDLDRTKQFLDTFSGIEISLVNTEYGKMIKIFIPQIKEYSSPIKLCIEDKQKKNIKIKDALKELRYLNFTSEDKQSKETTKINLPFYVDFEGKCIETGLYFTYDWKALRKLRFSEYIECMLWKAAFWHGEPMEKVVEDEIATVKYKLSSYEFTKSGWYFLPVLKKFILAENEE